MVERIRKKTDVPLVFTTYANVVFSYGKGTGDFIRKAEIGMNDLISLIAPTSHERIKLIAKEANGFVICDCSWASPEPGPTLTTDIGAMVKLVKEAKDIPCLWALVSLPRSRRGDGLPVPYYVIIYNSAIVKLCAAYGAECVPKVREYVKSMKDAVREVA